MSPLLAVALVLLVIVVGLTLKQRAHARRATLPRQVPPPGPTPTAAARTPPGGAASAGARSPNAIENDSSWVSRPDPVLGVITFDGRIWVPDDDVRFGDTTVVVEIAADERGPSAPQRELLRIALDQSRDLDARARALVRQELDRRRVGEADLDPYELSVRPNDQGQETGYLWYEVSEVDREMGVSSIDGWRTVRLEVVD